MSSKVSFYIVQERLRKNSELLFLSMVKKTRTYKDPNDKLQETRVVSVVKDKQWENFGKIQPAPHGATGCLRVVSVVCATSPPLHLKTIKWSLHIQKSYRVILQIK